MATAPRTPANEEKPVAEFDVTKTPEFQAALNAAVGKALIEHIAPLKEKIESARAGEIIDAGTVDSGAENLLQRLAHLIADVGDQGSGRPPRLPPEVLAKREESRRRMFDAINDMQQRVKALREAGRKGEALQATPRYRAMTKMLLENKLIPPFTVDGATKLPVPVEFYWTGPPNQAMRPINQAALEIFGHYRDWIGGVDTSTAKPGFISPKGVVILVGERYSPPVSAMQRNGFQPDFGEDEEFGEETGSVDQERESGLEIAKGAYGGGNATDPRAKQVRILGTIAEPATQGHPGDMVRRSV